MSIFSELHFHHVHHVHHVHLHFLSDFCEFDGSSPASGLSLCTVFSEDVGSRRVVHLLGPNMSQLKHNETQHQSF